MPENINIKLWETFVNAITGQMQGGATAANFLPTNGLSLANWQNLNSTGLVSTGQNPPAIGSTNVAGLETWADLMPVLGGTYVGGDSFFDAYVSFLHSINLTGGDPGQQQIADSYAITLTTERKQLTTDLNSVGAAWGTFNSDQSAIPPTSQTSYSDWFNQNWQSQLATDQANVAAANTNYLAALQAVGGPDYQTVSNALSKAVLGTTGNGILDVATGTTRPFYTISPDLNNWFLAGLQSVTGQKGPGFGPVTIDLSQAGSSTFQQSSYANSQVSGGYGWFFGGGGSSSSSTSQSGQDLSSYLSDVHMEYSAQEIQAFSVSPGSWYDHSMIVGFHDKISPGSVYTKRNLFGSGGELYMRTAQIYVVFKPSMTLRGSSATIQKINSAFSQQSSSSVSIGGWFWSGSASQSQGSQNSSATVATSSDGTSITITDNTNAPKVLGIIPEVLLT